LAIAAGLLGAGQVTAASASTLTINPASPGGGNCYPFGVGSGGSPGWNPFAGFVYKNVPAFQLRAGDVLAFDLGGTNPEADIQFQIDLARTTVNGGDIPSGGFTTVAANTQTPLNPRGDAITGNYELQFTSLAPFSFPGGGLIIRFSNASTSYATDTTCSSTLTNAATSTDPSGNFVERFFNDPDGNAPWANPDLTDIGGFRLTLADIPATAPTPQSQPVATKKKCKKHKKHHAASTAKNHCKKHKKQ
jgi:hypothetical protein